jgi:predicted SAM-dependent methyltransferase
MSIYIDDKHKTYEMCFDAVKSNGLLLECVPSEHRTVELYREAIKQNPDVVNMLLLPKKK